MNISKKARQISRSPTLSLNEKAQKLERSGKSIIHLGIGEPLNDAPRSAVQYSQNKLNSRQIKYGPTAGLPSLKENIQSYTKKYYGRTPALENIIVTAGAKQSLYNLLYSILNPGDEVILLAPYWVSYPEMVKLADGIPISIPPDDGLLPDLANVSRAVNPKTKAIILNSPNNPSGVVYPPEVIAAFVDYCESQELYLIMDDIYHQLVFNDQKWVPGYIFTSRPIEDSHLIVINGISKSYGMTGFRVGWTIGPEPLVQAMTKIQGHTTSGASVLLQEGARGALEKGQETVQELNTFIRDNRSLMLSGLKEIPGLKLIEPGGTFYCFPDFSAYYQSSEELAELLLEKAFLVTIPGTAFGLEGHLRLSYTCSKDQINESLNRIRWVIDDSAPSSIIMGNEKYTCSWQRTSIR
ncbi:MAG: pyridoxal phosphate-dependent aminotransferase [Anaerolineales bacterium]|nr:pyridoxal phosphate-dependent aminotransferase [Anaerolineales bacterium]